MASSVFFQFFGYSQFCAGGVGPLLFSAVASFGELWSTGHICAFTVSLGHTASLGHICPRHYDVLAETMSEHTGRGLWSGQRFSHCCQPLLTGGATIYIDIPSGKQTWIWKNTFAYIIYDCPLKKW